MKTKTIITVILLFPMLLISLRGKSQGTVPNISVVGLVNFPDTAYEGQTYFQIGLVFKNNDTINNFSGALSVYIKGDSANVDTFYNTTQLTIAANDTAALFTSNGFQFDPGTFRAGSNIVVVWPVVNGMLNTDTLYTSVFYVRASGLVPLLTGIESFDAYPNPANNYLGFILPHKSVAESVRIYNMYGCIVYESARLFQKRIDISALRQGCYFVIITDTKGKRFQRKVLKY